ncbi:hypothetical protein RHSIM_Rhsim07G0129900 [Rhododendron simsii]|uniref:RRM domain-containing protein n=1 Tax=Rhododendron simsii TaxID=118357 RepID=A0A834GM62_RHOSS|nr:hypothetical protein RHSIM_Rhsim07G0129900 [Rhododendron simsii]
MAKATLVGDQQQKQLGLWFGSAEGPQKTATGECEESRIVEVNKRKRTEEKKPSLDTAPIDDGDDSGIRLIKKSKRDDIESAEFSDDIKSSDLGSSLKGEKSSELGSSLNRESEPNESLESGKYSDLVSEFEEVLKQVEGKYLDSGMTEKKKRKRDEIEAEYKERRCGAMGMNEGGGGGGLRGKVVGEKRKHVDDPVDMMMVSKDDGFDDEAILLRTAFVGNLPLKVKKKALVKEFSQFGEIESIRIRSVPLLDTKIPRKGAVIQKKTSDAVDSVHAYVVFKTEEAAQASLANDMALVGGNHVRVDRACPPRKKLKGVDATLYDNKRTVFVGNLPFDVKVSCFSSSSSPSLLVESTIEAIRVIRDCGTSVGKGIAYVLFKTRGGANLVRKKRSLKLRDCELRLYHARSNLTPSKRKHSSPEEGENSNTKKLAVDLRTSDNSNKVKTKSGSSHQGLRASTSGASEQAGKKRKLESQTPESYRSNKKLRKLR